MKYYDKEEALKYRTIDLVLNTPESQYKDEKREFFNNHRYILGVMRETNAKCIKEYYGLDDGIFKSYEEIAKKMGCTRENIRRRISNGFRSIGVHMFQKLLATYTDEDIGYTEENKDEFDVIRLQEIYKTIVSKKNKEDERQLFQLPEEDRKAEMAFNSLLDKKFFSIDWTTPIDSGVQWMYSHCTFRDILTQFSEEDINDNRKSKIVSIIKSMGLTFLDEYEYIKDWKDDCVKAIKEYPYGLDNFIKSFGLIVSDNMDMVNLLNASVGNLRFGNRVDKILRQNNIKTIGDLIALKKSELSKFRNLGDFCAQEIVGRLNMIDLTLCPEFLSSSDWIEIVLNDENYKNIKLEEGQEEGIMEMEMPQSKFETLMQTSIYDLDFSTRSKNMLSRNNIKTINDLILLSKEEIMKYRNVGVVVLDDIVNVLAKLNLGLRPANTPKEVWIEELKDGFENKSKKNKEQTTSKKQVINLNEIPEELKKYVCKAVGQEIQEEMKDSTYEILLNRTMQKYKNKRIPEWDKKYELDRVRFVQDNKGESVENVLDCIEEDLNYIYSLESDFIEKNKDALSVFVLQNQSMPMVERLNLIKYINDPKIDELEK